MYNDTSALISQIILKKELLVNCDSFTSSHAQLSHNHPFKLSTKMASGATQPLNRIFPSCVAVVKT